MVKSVRRASLGSVVGYVELPASLPLQSYRPVSHLSLVVSYALKAKDDRLLFRACECELLNLEVPETFVGNIYTSVELHGLQQTAVQ